MNKTNDVAIDYDLKLRQQRIAAVIAIADDLRANADHIEALVVAYNELEPIHDLKADNPPDDVYQFRRVGSNAVAIGLANLVGQYYLDNVACGGIPD